MPALDYAKIRRRADALHASAKDGTLRLNDQTYTFRFDPRDGVYDVTDESGARLARYNTRKLTVARQWLREYFAD